MNSKVNKTTDSEMDMESMRTYFYSLVSNLIITKNINMTVSANNKKVNSLNRPAKKL